MTPSCKRSSLLLALLAAVAASACRTSGPAPAPPATEAPGGAAPPPGAPPSTAAGALLGPASLSARELIARIEWRAYQQGIHPRRKEALDLATDGRTLYQTSANIVRERAAAELARQRGCNPTADEFKQEVARRPAAAELFGLTPEQRQERFSRYQLLDMQTAEAAITDDLLRFCLIQKLSDALTPKDFHAEWIRATDFMVATLAVVRLPVPFETLDRIERERASDIDAYYRENPTEFWVPPQTRISLLRINAAPSVGRDTLRRIDEQMRQWRDEIAANPARFEELARLHSNDASAPRGGDFGWVTQEQYRDAFTLPVGELSQPIRRPLSIDLIKVHERRGVRRKPLDGPLRREIAAILARSSGPSEAETALAAQVLEAFNKGEAFIGPLRSTKGVEVVETPVFGRERNGMVPGVGPRPELNAFLFDSLRAEGAVTPRPFWAGREFVVAKAISRNLPDPQQWTEGSGDFSRAQAPAIAGDRMRDLIDALGQPEVNTDALAELLRQFVAPPAAEGSGTAAPGSGASPPAAAPPTR
jgi:hypothetical protein